MVDAARMPDAAASCLRLHQDRVTAGRQPAFRRAQQAVFIW
jgi:hypothetical protein